MDIYLDASRLGIYPPPFTSPSGDSCIIFKITGANQNARDDKYICFASNIVYQATVTSNTTTETYVGLATNFKERYRNHTASFRNHKKKNENELSKYIWTLKNANKPFSIKWRILRKCKPYNNISKKCNLCLSEKFFIICKNELCSLNKRNELAS